MPLLLWPRERRLQHVLVANTWKAAEVALTEPTASAPTALNNTVVVAACIRSRLTR